MGFDGFEERSLAAVADELDEALGDTGREGDVLGAGEDVGLLDDIVHNGDRVIGHLAAVGAVCLVAVVLGGVVGRSDHDARVAVVVPGGKAQCRDRVQRVIDADFDAVGGEDAGRGFREVPALETAVIGDGDGLSAALGLDPVCDALGGLTDDPDVHTVGTGAQRAAKAGGTEFQRDGEAVRNGVLVAFDGLQLSLQVEVLELGFHPALVFVHVHKNTTPSGENYFLFSIKWFANFSQEKAGAIYGFVSVNRPQKIQFGFIRTRVPLRARWRAGRRRRCRGRHSRCPSGYR